MIRKDRVKNLVLTSITIIILIILYIFLNKHYGFYIPCLFHKLTGYYCPGCGATRCILSLLKGNIKSSFQYNPLFFILIPFLSFEIIYKIYIYLANKEDKITKKIPNVVWIVLLIITISFGILRNIKGFEYLRP